MFLHRRNPFVNLKGKLSDPGLNGTIKKRWVEESFSAEEIKGGTPPLREFLGLGLSGWRLGIIAALILIVIISLWGRLFYLQIWRGSDYRGLAESNRVRVKPIVAERGIIYARDLTPLVANIPNFTLNINPQDLPMADREREEVLIRIAALSQAPLEQIKSGIKEFERFSFRSVTLRDNLDYETAVRLKVAGAELPGLEIETSSRRQYLFTEPPESAASSLSLAHLLGFVGKTNKNDLTLNPSYLPTDFIGKIGLEKSYEKILRGQYGKKEIEVDALGKEKNVIGQEPPEAGKNLVLALDLELQKEAEKIFTAHLRASGKKRGVVIALDPRNGEIMALVNWPSFNNNLFSRGISAEEYQKLLIDPNAPLFSRAWAGSFPSGSIIKPIIAAAALNEGIINRQTTFLSAGGLQVNRWFFPDWKAGGHGPTNVIKALAESVNTFFFIIGGGYQNFVGLGLDKLTEYLKKFGLANTLGLDLPGEAAGFIPSREWKEETKKERWYIGDTYNLSIGQGDLLVTPLQVAALTVVFANGGTLYEPHLLKSRLDPKTNERVDFSPVVLEKQVLPKEIIQIVREGLRAAVTSGSARLLSSLPFETAGKTGTAQWSSKNSPHAWFTGFGPYQSPELVLTILIEEGGEGSHTAVPVADEIFDWWWKNKK